MYQRKGENRCWPHSHGKLLTVTKTWPLGTPWWSSGWDSALPLQGGTSLIPGQGTRILHAMQYSQKKKRLLTSFLISCSPVSLVSDLSFLYFFCKNEQVYFHIPPSSLHEGSILEINQLYFTIFVFHYALEITQINS